MRGKGSIIYVGGFELPDKNAAAQRVVSNAKILRDIGYEVILIDSCREQDTELEQKDECFGFKRWSIKKSNKQLYSIDRIVKIIEEQNSVVAVIAYNYPAIALDRLRKFCNSRNIKIIADVTEWYGPLGDNIIRQIIKGLDSYYRMNIIHPKVDGIIAISRYLENYYEAAVPTVILPPLADRAEEKWNQLVCEEQSDKVTILYAGTPGKHKDKLNLILRALDQCNKQKYLFKIIGITAEQYLAYYPEDEELLKSLGESVCFLGRKSHVDVIGELKKADFSLFYREITRVTMAGFPTKFAEAITAGTPVLTNKTSDLEDYLVEGVNGFWVDDIDGDLLRIINMDIQELRKIKSAIEKDAFDYHRYIDKICMFLEQLIH